MSKKQIVLVFCAVVLAGFTGKAYADTIITAEITEYDTVSGIPMSGDDHEVYQPDGIWTWYGDPKAVYYEGTYRKTYISYFDLSTPETGKVVVTSYNHENGEIQSAVLDPDEGWDDHNHPSILIRPDGRILAFWCGHSGGSMRMRMSTNPEDVTEWEETQTIITGSSFTYPNPYMLSEEDNRIYIFYRGIDWQQTLAYSDDLGETWEPAIKYFEGGNRPYHKYHSNGVDEIHTVTEYDNRALPAQYMCLKNGAFYNADGTMIRTLDDVRQNGPINSGDIDEIFIRGTTTNCANWDISLDGQGNPVFVMDSIQNGHHYYYTRWDGSQWVKHYLVNSGEDMGGEFGFACGITLDHENPNIVYLSRWIDGDNGSYPELARWVTQDGGETWSVTPITRNSTAKNARPCVPRGYTGGDISVIWIYGTYGNWFGPFDMDILMYTFENHPPGETPVTFNVSSERSRKSIVTCRGNRVDFMVTDPSAAYMKMFDGKGRLVADMTGFVREKSAGLHSLKLENERLAGGTYTLIYSDGINESSEKIVNIR